MRDVGEALLEQLSGRVIQSAAEGGIHAPEDLKLVIREVTKGLYIVENAYAGDAEYFPAKANKRAYDVVEEEIDKNKKVPDPKK